MRKPYQTPFSNRNSLNIMLNLRLNGYSVRTLSLLFHCEKKAIRYQLQKYAIEPQEESIYGIEKVLNPILVLKVPEMNRWAYINGEKVSRGKNYTDYIKDLKKRSPRK